jgi:hypothetical protein
VEREMTRLLEEAFARVSELPEDAQDDVARWLLSELESEQRWATLLESSSGALTQLADEALAERERGETQELDPQKL